MLDRKINRRPMSRAASLAIILAMLMIVAWVADKVEPGKFTIGGFPPDFGVEAIAWAIVGAVVLSIVSTIIGMVVPD